MDDKKIVVEVPELALVAEHSVPLAQDAPLFTRQVRGDRDRAPDVRSQVRVGVDVARMSTRANESPQVQDRRADADFFSVLIALTFDPADPEKFASAWLTVNLAGEGEGQRPIAFLLVPSRQEEQVGVENSGGIDATVKVLKVSGATKRSFARYESEILAEGRLTSTPGWEIQPSNGPADRWTIRLRAGRESEQRISGLGTPDLWRFGRVAAQGPAPSAGREDLAR